MVWSLPTPEHETYAPFDSRALLSTFIGHTDGIWDMVLLPLRLRDEALLATISADGTIKVWSTDELNSPLKLSWGYYGTLEETTEEGKEEMEKEVEWIKVGNESEKKVKITPTCLAAQNLIEQSCPPETNESPVGSIDNEVIESKWAIIECVHAPICKEKSNQYFCFLVY